MGTTNNQETNETVRVQITALPRSNLDLSGIGKGLHAGHRFRNISCVRELQSPKAKNPMLVTESGISMSLKELHL